MAAPFIGLFEHIQLFRNLKFTMRWPIVFQNNIMSSIECTAAATYLAFKQALRGNQEAYEKGNGPAKFCIEDGLDWLRRALGDSKGSPGNLILTR